MPPGTQRSDHDEQLRAEAFEWLMQLEAAPADAELAARADRWIAESDAHRRAFDSVERAWRLAGELPADYAAQVSSARRPDGAIVPGPAPRRARPIGMAAAAVALAACLVVVLLPFLPPHPAADHRTGVGELRRVMLEDGSVASLDAASAIDVRYTPERRIVMLLAGQALFEVEADPARPFVVDAQGVRTTVTGTTFAVARSSEVVTVTVRSGTVTVAAEGERDAGAYLAAGDRVAVDPASGHMRRSAFPAGDVGAWRERRLVVHDASLAEVIAELDRHQPGMILAPDRELLARRVTGVFDLRHPVEALRAAAGTLRAEVTELTPFLLVVTGR